MSDRLNTGLEALLEKVAVSKGMYMRALGNAAQRAGGALDQGIAQRVMAGPGARASRLPGAGMLARNYPAPAATPNAAPQGMPQRAAAPPHPDMARIVGMSQGQARSELGGLTAEQVRHQGVEHEMTRADAHIGAGAGGAPHPGLGARAATALQGVGQGFRRLAPWAGTGTLATLGYGAMNALDQDQHYRNLVNAPLTGAYGG